MAFSQAAAGRSAVADINITPLVDVMLVLLVIFMLAIPVIEAPMTLSLPQQNEDPPPPSEPIELRVTADGQFMFGGQTWDRQSLQGLLTVESTRSPQPVVHLIADQEAPYDRITEALNLARSSGLTQIGMP